MGKQEGSRCLFAFLRFFIYIHSNAQKAKKEARYIYGLGFPIGEQKKEKADGHKAEKEKDMENMEKNNIELDSSSESKETAKQEKTFTQAEVDEIVSKRLAREKKTAADAGTEREAELNRKEMELNIKMALVDNGLPRELAEVLRVDKPEDIEKIITMIGKYIKPAADTKKDNEENRGFRIGNPNEGNAEGADPYRKAMGL